jgi:hypothetical protein
MKAYEINNRIFEISVELNKANSLLNLVFTYVLDFAKADPNSKNEEERTNALTLCSQYEMWSDTIRTAYDITFDTQKELDALADEIYPK